MQRRAWLIEAGRLTALAASGCVGGALARPLDGPYPFSLGVASGDPLPDGVILWTRVLHDPLRAEATAPIAYQLRWEVAADQNFRRVVAKGSVTALPEMGHSVHVDVRGLAPDRWYWYRFMLGDAVSPVARTRTAPPPEQLSPAMKLAVASCQHWEFGYYTAHRYLAEAAPDLVAFVGDYIYEWGPYRLSHAASKEDGEESTTLAEYRARYAQYKSDPLLQGAHHVAPWIVTWDDHEVVNDYANDRDYVLDPDFLARRAAAYQAFYEHMPIRLQLPANHNFAHTRIERSIDWGQLARFHILDDRQYRSWQVCPKPGHGGSNSATLKACPAFLDPARTMLGNVQEDWFAASLASSRARWNIITQQTLMAQSNQLPAKDGEGRFWTDGWDGYPVARKRLLETVARSRASNPLVLSGDVHTFYATELRPDFFRPAGADNPVVATEFVGTSITSSSRPQARTQQYVDMNPHLKYGRSDRRGYMLLTVRPQAVDTLFLGLDDVHKADSAQRTLASFQVQDGRPAIIRT
ncbi:alkaline phosphatase D family protein [Massilia sp. TS11]|uniref:alkaline phosphatase D family protein n=1 Tax=Massilia sp. TS11 TaxID=2908003 RepID=UPI0027D99023|nr:alkaline phosphatase D family protein [Massilia sp. TS11]